MENSRLAIQLEALSEPRNDRMISLSLSSLARSPVVSPLPALRRSVRFNPCEHGGLGLTHRRSTEPLRRLAAQADSCPPRKKELFRKLRQSLQSSTQRLSTAQRDSAGPTGPPRHLSLISSADTASCLKLFRSYHGEQVQSGQTLTALGQRQPDRWLTGTFLEVISIEALTRVLKNDLRISPSWHLQK